MGNPWIFRQIEEYLQNGQTVTHPSLEEVLDTLLQHMELCVSHYGDEVRGIKISRKLVIWYTRGIHNIKHLRPKANFITTMEETKALLNEIRAECAA